MKFDTNFSRNRDSSMWSFVRKHRINWINHTIRADVYLTPNSHRGAVSQVASIASTYSRELDGEFDSRPLARSTKDLFPDRTGQELGDHACARKVYRRHNRHNRDIRLSGTQCCCKSVAVAAAPIAARRAADKRRECIQCNYDVSRRSHSARFFFPLLFSPSPSSFFFYFFSFPRARLARAHPWEFTTIHHWNTACSIAPTPPPSTCMRETNERPVISSVGPRDCIVFIRESTLYRRPPDLCQIDALANRKKAIVFVVAEIDSCSRPHLRCGIIVEIQYIRWLTKFIT